MNVLGSCAEIHFPTLQQRRILLAHGYVMFVARSTGPATRPPATEPRSRVMPTSVPFFLWIADAAVIVCWLALLAYRAQVTRYEDDQLFLSDESGQHARAQQSAIVNKVDKIGPVVRILGVAAILMTLAILSVPVWAAVKTILEK
jgi:hypothetical protein